ncbi:MAG: hypothetical protein ACI4RK_07610 [Oscillospiraceae bacterium]
MTVSKKQQAHVNKYISTHYEHIAIRVKTGERDRYKHLAEKLGVSVNQLFLQAVEEFIAEHVADE